MSHEDSSFGVSRRRALIASGIALAALLVLSGCAAANGPSPSATPSASELAAPAPSSAAPEPSASPSASPSVPASPTQPDGPSLLEVDGRWCPTTPADWGDSCYVVELPEVRIVGDDDPSHVMYVYPSGRADEDPRGFTDEDYAFGPQYGECWVAAVDGYPAMSGAEFVYCPAGAKSGEGYIDDPLHTDMFASEQNLQDYTGQDRLYMSQDMNPYPDVRTAE